VNKPPLNQPPARVGATTSKPGVDDALSHVGAVIIGRNEGERLRICLASVRSQLTHVVYVDSGSTDGSVAMAQAMGVQVVSLDMKRPFTAARARNAGCARLRSWQSQLSLVQFVDGDCEVDSTWLRTAVQFLTDHPDVAVVCGRRRERFPSATVYNLMCDLEWNTPVGEARACGGDALMRLAPLVDVSGYREDLIAGEEPELCLRFRAKGWRIWRLDADMTLHDAAIFRFGQWWKRTTRAGFAYAEGAHLHGAPPERHWVREARSAAIWGAAIPLLVLASAIFLGSWFSLLLLIYPLQVLRLFVRSTDGGALRTRFLRAFFLVAGKFPEAQGQLQFWLRVWSGGTAKLIEYK
jgi:glycosyltransferase involved in cell wall biosynthesis